VVGVVVGPVDRTRRSFLPTPFFVSVLPLLCRPHPPAPLAMALCVVWHCLLLCGLACVSGVVMRRVESQEMIGSGSRISAPRSSSAVICCCTPAQQRRTRSKAKHIYCTGRQSQACPSSCWFIKQVCPLLLFPPFDLPTPDNIHGFDMA